MKRLLLTSAICLAATGAFAQSSDIKEIPLTLEEFNDLWSQLENAAVPHKITGPMEMVLTKAANRAVAPKPAPAAPPAPNAQPQN